VWGSLYYKSFKENMEYFEKERNLNSTADKPKIQKLKRRCKFLQ
jgi:hypothetical protein